MTRPVIIAHRGAAGICPENTMAAFRAAIEMGVDLVEFDVHLAAGGEVVVIHDSTVDRTTNGAGAVREKTVEELRLLDAGSWRGDNFAGQTIPTLHEVLGLLAPTGVRPLVELKVYPGEPYRELVAGVISVLEDGDMLPRTVAQSFSVETVSQLRASSAPLALGLLVAAVQCEAYGPEPGRVLDVTLDAGADTLCIEHSQVTAALVREAHARDVPVWAWTVDDEQHMRRLTEVGVDGVISNRPEVLVSLAGGE